MHAGPDNCQTARMIASGQLVVSEYQGEKYYLKKFVLDKKETTQKKRGKR